MRNWEPYLADTLAKMAAAGVRRAVGVILAPHATEASRERYIEAVDAGRAALGDRAPEIVYVSSWHMHPHFVTAVADATVAALVAIPAARRAAARLVFTAHSVPVPMAERSPYVAELTASARAVAERLQREHWVLAYQSRSGRPGDPWLEPDVNDVLRTLASEGARDAVLVPVGFVADHVEVLYDLDVEARATGRAVGLEVVRAGTVGDHPLFARMLADVIAAAAA
jgi:ferrochelatase